MTTTAPLNVSLRSPNQKRSLFSQQLQRLIKIRASVKPMQKHNYSTRLSECLASGLALLVLVLDVWGTTRLNFSPKHLNKSNYHPRYHLATQGAALQSLHRGLAQRSGSHLGSHIWVSLAQGYYLLMLQGKTQDSHKIGESWVALIRVFYLGSFCHSCPKRIQELKLVVKHFLCFIILSFVLHLILFINKRSNYAI